MIDFKPSERSRHLPFVQMIPLIDVLFINLSFFMAVFVFFHLEADLSVSVPEAQQAVQSGLTTDEIIINIARDGAIVVSQKKLSSEALLSLLRRTAKMYPDQSVIVRGDQKTYHEDIIKVLDVCAKANISKISFATVKDQ
jgi:biopolymer transport protein ExbD